MPPTERLGEGGLVSGAKTFYGRRRSAHPKKRKGKRRQPKHSKSK